MVATPTQSSREIAREAVRARLASIALGHFTARGFDNVTVTEVAQVAGVSRSTFLRYFETKEDAVLCAVDPAGEAATARLLERPAGEDDWTALRRCLDDFIADYLREPEHAMAGLRLVNSVPAINGRRLQRQRTWAANLAHALDHRHAAVPPAAGPSAVVPPAVVPVAAASTAAVVPSAVVPPAVVPVAAASTAAAPTGAAPADLAGPPVASLAPVASPAPVAAPDSVALSGPVDSLVPVASANPAVSPGRVAQSGPSVLALTRANVALACMTVAVDQWTAADGRLSLSALVDDAFAALPVS